MYGAFGSRMLWSRCFSTSNRLLKSGPIVSFRQTSSTNINELLSSIRLTKLLPRRLSSEQRHQIYKDKYREMLEKEPPVVDIDGEKFTLKHVDITKDEPPTEKSFRTILEDLSPNDWDIFPQVSAAYMQLASKKNILKWQKHAVDQALRVNRLEMIFEAAQRVHLTGYVLRDKRLVERILRAFLSEAERDHFRKRTLERALSRAEELAEILEWPKHCGDCKFESENDDPRRSSEVIAIFLELAALRCSKLLEGKDEDGKVAMYAERLAGSIFDYPLTKTESPLDRNVLLIRAVPTLHAIQIAKTILPRDSEVLKELDSKTNELRQTAKLCYETREDLPDEKLYGKTLYKDSVIGFGNT